MAAVRLLDIVASKKLHRKPLTYIAALGLAGAIFIPLIFFITLFIILGAASTIYKSHFNIGLDLELQSFFTVAAGQMFGPGPGAFVGFFSVLLGHFMNLMFMGNPILSLVYASSFALLGLLSASVPLGILLVFCTAYVLANDLMFVVLGSMLGANPARLIVAAVIHPIFVCIVLGRILIPIISVVRGAS